mmetsp:Transcript_7619/g.25229  ORF Transcript_7619/g.25229 Transcript_7619/m.25229 type:complete len:265 (+) Transcript_7619:809-1603(+)
MHLDERAALRRKDVRLASRFAARAGVDIGEEALRAFFDEHLALVRVGMSRAPLPRNVRRTVPGRRRLAAKGGARGVRGVKEAVLLHRSHALSPVDRRPCLRSAVLHRAHGGVGRERARGRMRSATAELHRDERGAPKGVAVAELCVVVALHRARDDPRGVVEIVPVRAVDDVLARFPPRPALAVERDVAVPVLARAVDARVAGDAVAHAGSAVAAPALHAVVILAILGTLAVLARQPVRVRVTHARSGIRSIGARDDAVVAERR